MSAQQYPIAYYPPPHSPMATPESPCSALVQLATIGAVVGASAAAGANIGRMQRDEITAGEALIDTGRAAVTAAAASAIAGAAATAVSSQGLVRLAILFAAGSAVSYAIQRRWSGED